MNTDASTSAPCSRPEWRSADRAFRPRLSFYHANGRGGAARLQRSRRAATATAWSIDPRPAEERGHRLGRAGQPPVRHLRLDEPHLHREAQFRRPLPDAAGPQGQAATIADSRASTTASTTMINLTRQTEPHPGHALEVSRRGRATPSRPRASIVFAAELAGSAQRWNRPSACSPSGSRRKCRPSRQEADERARRAGVSLGPRQALTQPRGQAHRFVRSASRLAVVHEGGTAAAPTAGPAAAPGGLVAEQWGYGSFSPRCVNALGLLARSVYAALSHDEAVLLRRARATILPTGGRLGFDVHGRVQRKRRPSGMRFGCLSRIVAVGQVAGRETTGSARGRPARCP